MITPIPICPYCRKEAQLFPDIKVYRKSYGGNVWACIPCDAWVGCHRGTPGTIPLGRLANKRLRILKSEGHRYFDVFWKSAMQIRGWSKSKARDTAYEWLSMQMGIPFDECHFGMMDENRCLLAIDILKKHHNQILSRRSNS